MLVLPVQAQEQSFNASIAGERNIGQWYNFTISNVSGYSRASYHYVVYNAYFRDNYSYLDENWQDLEMQYPGPGQKYLFVWIAGYLDDSSTDWWGWDRYHFPMWYNNVAVVPEPVTMVSTQFTLHYWNHDHPRLIGGMENASYYPGFTWSGEPYGFYDGVELDRMYPGITNAYNGYVIYQVPKQATMDQIRIAMNTYTDQAWWNIQNKTFEQVDNVAKANIQDRILIETQKERGLRLPDTYEVKRSEA